MHVCFYKCLNCNHQWRFEKCPISGIVCPVCRHKYIKWLNYPDIEKTNEKIEHTYTMLSKSIEFYW